MTDFTLPLPPEGLPGYVPPHPPTKLTLPDGDEWHALWVPVIRAWHVCVRNPETNHGMAFLMNSRSPLFVGHSEEGTPVLQIDQGDDELRWSFAEGDEKLMWQVFEWLLGLMKYVFANH